MRPAATPDPTNGATAVKVKAARATAAPVAAAVVAAALASFLSGCTAGPIQDQSTAGRSTPAAATLAATGLPSAGSAAVPSSEGATAAGTLATTGPNAGGDAADEVERTVAGALQALAARVPRPATDQVKEALTSAGIAPGALQVSASRTPTGLEADAIEAAVLQDRDCIIGQVREGAVAVTVLPVLASGRCFVGS